MASTAYKRPDQFLDTESVEDYLESPGSSVGVQMTGNITARAPAHN